MGSDGQLVVVGVDGSAHSAGALKWTADYCAATGARGRAVMAWHYPAATTPALIGRAPASVTEEVRQHEAQTLAQAVADAIPGATIDQEISYGHPAQVLIDQSTEADLLVLGSRGHSAYTGMLVGSVSMHCVTHAHCPVVVVREGA
jgi:nucleotide-binding universal stress UspA family protein